MKKRSILFFCFRPLQKEPTFSSLSESLGGKGEGVRGKKKGLSIRGKAPPPPGSQREKKGLLILLFFPRKGEKKIRDGRVGSPFTTTLIFVDEQMTGGKKEEGGEEPSPSRTFFSNPKKRGSRPQPLSGRDRKEKKG